MSVPSSSDTPGGDATGSPEGSSSYAHPPGWVLETGETDIATGRRAGRRRAGRCVTENSPRKENFQFQEKAHCSPKHWRQNQRSTARVRQSTRHGAFCRARRRRPRDTATGEGGAVRSGGPGATGGRPGEGQISQILVLRNPSI